MEKIIVTLSIFALFLSACAPAEKPDVAQNGIEIYQARILVPGGESMNGDDMEMMNLAAFMLIKNTSNSADRLLSVVSDFAEASIHETTMDGDVMKMEEVAGVDIPAGQSVELKSGSYHIMLVNPTKSLKVGNTVTLTLEFEKAGPIVVLFQVVAQ